LGTTLTNLNCMHEEIKDRSKLGNACYYLLQNLLSSSLLSRIMKMKMYRSINEAFESSRANGTQHFVRPVLTVLTAVGSTPQSRAALRDSQELLSSNLSHCSWTDGERDKRTFRKEVFLVGF